MLERNLRLQPFKSIHLGRVIMPWTERRKEKTAARLLGTATLVVIASGVLLALISMIYFRG